MKPPEQLTFIRDPVGAKNERDKGILLVSDHNADWQTNAVRRLSFLRGSKKRMTGEDMKIWLFENGLPPPFHDNAWGALVRYCATKGLIRPTGDSVLATTKQSHARRVVVWVFS